MSLNSLSDDLPRKATIKVETFEPGKRTEETEEGTTTKALEALTKFIPTEMLAPYVAGLSLGITQGWNATSVYWWFVIATPLVFVLFELAKSALENKPWPAKGPLGWRAIAATLAFAVWGLSVPTNPLQAVIGGAAVAGFFALIVSPVLTALDAVVLRLLKFASPGS